MSNPQQPELARSRKTPSLDPDATASVIDGQRRLGTDAPSGPVPVDNQPGHHPSQEQDKPDLDAFAQKLGIVETPESDTAPGEQARRRMAPAAIGAAVAGALAALLGLLVVRRRRSRR